MKNFLPNKIIMGAMVLGTLVFGLSVVLPVNAQTGFPGGDPTGPGEILKKSGNFTNGPSINQLQLSPKNNQPSSLGSSSVFGTSLQKVFRLMGQSIFDTVVAYRDTAVSMLYAGFTTQQGAGGSGIESSNSVPKLQVNGSITVKSLAQPGAAARVPVCTNDAGILTRTCPGGGLGGK